MGFKINRVYTRSGDSGETGLVGGRRVSKASSRVEVYGDIDELNSFLGLAKEQLSSKLGEVRQLVEELQQQLFDLGSELATDPADAYPEMWHVSSAHVERLEKLCDKYSEGLPELESFILPGGSVPAANFHIARTVARRAERNMIRLKDVSPESIQYINRLSDLFFVLARWALKVEGKAAPLWVKEKDR